MIWLAIAILGWLSGLLVNYLADVLPAVRRITKPICIYCHEHQPTKNYLIWPRTCNVCSRHRPLRVWFMEVIFIISSAWLWGSPPDRLGYPLGMILLIFFGLVVVIDIEHRLILHPVSIAGAILCGGVGWILHGPLNTIIGGAFGFGLMLALHYFGDRFARWLARKRGETLTEVALGFGDVNLSGVLGLLLGWPGILGGLLIAILFGGAFSLVYILGMVITRRYRAFAAIPYGPFLVASGILLIFFRDVLI